MSSAELPRSTARAWLGTRTARVSMLGLVTCAGLYASACSEEFRSCAETRDCDPEAKGGSGSSTGGSGGASGASGDDGMGAASAGTGGASGLGGVSGGNAGSDAGGSATGGSSGTSGNAGGGSGGIPSSAGEGGVGGAGGEGGSITPCDETRSPLEEACRVTDEGAIFVSPAGSDSAAGTREAPLATLGKAITVAAAADKFIVACQGTYKENLALTGATALELYGGFDCENGWTAGSALTLVAPEKGVPLTLKSVTQPVHLEALEFRAPNATVLGESSIAALVADSTNVSLKGLKLVAGNGANGTNGKTVGFTMEAVAPTGKTADGAAGGPFCSNVCPSGVSSLGGRGGDGQVGDSPAKNGDSGLPDSGAGKGGVGAGDCGQGGLGSGQLGAAATIAASGNGAASPGKLSGAGWVPTSGTVGVVGTPGQGGGGGGGGASPTPGTNGGGGGGGGCGGCGGKGGAPGTGAGGSIALLAFNSGIVLQGSQLTTGNGGLGGNGATGQAGQTGGTAGLPGDGTACLGGKGGKGATGGTGGGGAGGISVGLLLKGSVVTDGGGVSHTPGQAGAGGKGGTPGTNDGVAGLEQRILEF